MKSVEQQLQALTGMVRQLQRELGSLKRSDYRQSYVYTTNTLGAKHMRPDHTQLGSDLAVLSGLEPGRKIARYYPDTETIMLSPDPNDAELFDIASTGKDMKSLAALLTHRETQILNYVADGTTNKQIAYILGISEQTIKNHISAILRKLHANDRAHAVALAIRSGWLSAERKQEGMVPVS